MSKSTYKKRNIVCIMLLIFFTTSTIWQGIQERIENRKYKPTGIYINTGTYDASCYVRGKGKHTFVFITGSGTPSAYTDFYYLQEELSQYGQTISFDHAGFGWSSKTNEKRNIDNQAAELTVLINAFITKDSPVILVCHSLGSLEAIRFSQLNRDRVAGIIFLDGGSPEYYSTASEFTSILLNRTSAILRISGINRILGELDVLLPFYGENVRNISLNKKQQEIDKAMYYKYLGATFNRKNLKLINENAEKVLEQGNIGNIPILILSSDSGKEWSHVQEQLGNWSTNSKQIDIKGAGHYLHWTNYKDVIDNIKSFTSSLDLIS